MALFSSKTECPFKSHFVDSRSCSYILKHKEAKECYIFCATGISSIWGKMMISMLIFHLICGSSGICCKAKAEILNFADEENMTITHRLR